MVRMASDRHVRRVVNGIYDWQKDKRRKYEPIVKTCRCGKVFMPRQWDAREHPDKEFFCSPDCMYDARMIERPTHCATCGRLMPKTARPGARYCSRQCAGAGSHIGRDPLTYKGPTKGDGVSV